MLLNRLFKFSAWYPAAKPPNAHVPPKKSSRLCILAKNCSVNSYSTLFKQRRSSFLLNSIFLLYLFAFIILLVETVQKSRKSIWAKSIQQRDHVLNDVVYAHRRGVDDDLCCANYKKGDNKERTRTLTVRVYVAACVLVDVCRVDCRGHRRVVFHSHPHAASYDVHQVSPCALSFVLNPFHASHYRHSAAQSTKQHHCAQKSP